MSQDSSGAWVVRRTRLTLPPVAGWFLVLALGLAAATGILMAVGGTARRGVFSAVLVLLAVLFGLSLWRLSRRRIATFDNDAVEVGTLMGWDRIRLDDVQTVWLDWSVQDPIRGMRATQLAAADRTVVVTILNDVWAPLFPLIATELRSRLAGGQLRILDEHGRDAAGRLFPDHDHVTPSGAGRTIDPPGGLLDSMALRLAAPLFGPNAYRRPRKDRDPGVDAPEEKSKRRSRRPAHRKTRESEK